MRIDLHTHSTVSDGTDTPRDLVAKAAAAGLDVVALTDHDSTAGWDEAQQAADQHGIRLVRGIELSTEHLGRGQHLLGYGVDPTVPALADLIERGNSSRDGRVAETVARLADLGLYITVDDVARHAAGGTSGRPHVADALIEAGYVADRDEAFALYLKRGQPAAVRRWLPTLTDAVAAIFDAGGAAVLAHPWGRGGHIDESEIAWLTGVGLVGIEVDHQEHTAADRADLHAIARNLNLIVTGSSDHHGTGKVNHDLGCNTTDPEQFEALLAKTLTYRLIDTRQENS